MAPHEEFLELCAAATAGELTSGEQQRLDVHLEICLECRQTMQEYELAAQHGATALAWHFASEEAETDRAYSVTQASKAFLKRLSAETNSPRPPNEVSDSVIARRQFIGGECGCHSQRSCSLSWRLRSRQPDRRETRN